MTPEFLQNEIFIECCKSVISCMITLIFFALVVVAISKFKKTKVCVMCGSNFHGDDIICSYCKIAIHGEK